MQPQSFTAVLAADDRGRACVVVPFDPDQVWRPKPRHHITGTIGGRDYRGVIETRDGRRVLVLGPAWLRDGCLVVGEPVAVRIAPEGPQRDELAEDVAAALAADPAAAAFFDSLAQFYTRAYLRWIDATSRRPEERARRIEEVVRLLGAGIKQRPKR